MPTSQDLPNKSVLSLKKVGKHFAARTGGQNPKPALQDIDLEISAGERVAILGPSGAGKSTLLKICAGIFPPDSGEVQIFQKSPKSFASLSRRQRSSLVGLMHQNFDLIGPLKVAHNIQAGQLGRWNSWQALLPLLLPLIGPATHAAAEAVNISELLAQRADSLSGGEQQRVAFARLLVQNPQLLLADEPVASVDPARAESLLNLLATQSATAVVMSLHAPTLAQSFATRVVGLKAGRVFFDLPSSQLNQAHLEELYSFPERVP